MQHEHIRDFVDRHFLHFNAATLRDASRAYAAHLKAGGKMLLTLAGAMSTAELGIILAEMIRKDKVHAICCTGANLEEDLYNLISHPRYEILPNYRHLSPEDDLALAKRGFCRVTDTCFPEDETITLLLPHLLKVWQRAEQEGKRY